MVSANILYMVSANKIIYTVCGPCNRPYVVSANRPIMWSLLIDCISVHVGFRIRKAKLFVCLDFGTG